MSLRAEFQTLLRRLHSSGQRSIFDKLRLNVETGTLKTDLLTEIEECPIVGSLAGFEELSVRQDD